MLTLPYPHGQLTGTKAILLTPTDHPHSPMRAVKVIEGESWAAWGQHLKKVWSAVIKTHRTQELQPRAVFVSVWLCCPCCFIYAAHIQHIHPDWTVKTRHTKGNPNKHAGFHVFPLQINMIETIPNKTLEKSDLENQQGMKAEARRGCRYTQVVFPHLQ